MLYEALREYLVHDAPKAAVGVMKQLVVVHLAGYASNVSKTEEEGAAESAASHLDKARVMSQHSEKLLEQMDDWQGLVDSLMKRSRHFELLGMEEEADAICVKAVDVANNHSAAVGRSGVMARMMLAQRRPDEEAQKLYVRAMQDARALAKLGISNPANAELLATCYLTRGRHEIMKGSRYEAGITFLTYAEKYLTAGGDMMKETLVDSMSHRVHALAMLGKQAEAVEVVKKILEMGTEDADSLIICAYAVASSGDNAKAIELLYKARDIKTEEDADPEEIQLIDNSIEGFRNDTGVKDAEVDETRKY